MFSLGRACARNTPNLEYISQKNHRLDTMLI